MAVLTDTCRDDAQEQQDYGDVRLWHCARRHIVKQHRVVSPVDGGTVRQQGLIASSHQRVRVLLPFARHPPELSGRVGGDVGHQQAEVHGAAWGKYRAHTQQQAAQVDAAGDYARVHQAVGLPESGEHDGAQKPRYGRNTHQQAEKGAADALRVGVACGDAVEAQDGGVEEGQAHPRQEDGLAVVGLPAVLASAHQPAEPLKAQRQAGDLLQLEAGAAVAFQQSRRLSLI